MTLPLGSMRQAVVIGGSQRHVDPPGPIDVVTPATVASVTLVPAAFSLSEGSVLRGLTAIPKNTGGGIVTGRTATWTSSDAAVATVAPSAALTADVTAVSASSPALFSEPVDDGNFSARGWYDGGFTFDPTESNGGAGSIRATFNAGATSPTSGGMRILFAETDRVHLTYYVKYSSNYIGSQATFHPHEWMFITDEDIAFVAPADTRLSVAVETLYQNVGSGIMARFGATDNANIDQANIGSDLTGVTEIRSANGCNGFLETSHNAASCFDRGDQFVHDRQWDHVGQISISDANKTAWNKISVQIQLNTISGGTADLNGILRYWVNDVLVIEHIGVVLRTGQYPNMKFNQLILKPFMNPAGGSPVTQTIWYDDIEIRTGSGTGTAIITGTVDGVSGTSLVTVTSAVSTVSITPASFAIPTPQTQALIGLVLDSSGAALVGRNMNWSTTDAGILTVTPGTAYNATATAISTGAATITATVEGVSGTTAGTVSSGTALYPNEPAGYTRFLEIDFTTALTHGIKNSPGAAIDGVVWIFTQPGGSTNFFNPVTVANGGQQSPPNVFQYIYRGPQLHQGTSPGIMHMWDDPANETSGTEYREVYESFWFNIVGAGDGTYENQTVGTKIFGYWGSGENNKGVQPTSHYFFVNGDGLGGNITTIMTALNFNMRQQSWNERILSHNVNTSFRIIPGVWYHYECVQILSSLNGLDGTWRLWLNGTLVMDHTDVNFRDNANPSGFWGRHWRPVLGGGDALKTRDDLVQIDHVYISGIPK